MGSGKSLGRTVIPAVSPHRMKIAYICNEYPPAPHGGIGTFLQTIARGMLAAGHEVSVAGWGPVPREWSDQGVQVTVLPESRLRGLSWILNRLRLGRWLQRRAEAGQLDLVEAPEFQGPLLLPFRAVPLIARLHLSATAIARHAGHQPRGMTQYCEKRMLQICPAWIGVSRFALELTRRTFHLTPQRSAIINYPVVAEPERADCPPDLPERFALFAGGTVSERKGAYLLAEAARTFLAKYPDLKLVYAGPLAAEGNASAADRICELLGPALSQRVRFLGRIPRAVLLACMRRAKVFAYPSTLETFGLVTAEAMLQGCAVVVANVGPCPEFVKHEATGLLVPPGDAAALAGAVENLLDHPEFASRLGNAGCRSVQQRFTRERCVADSLSFYEAVVSEFRQRRPSYYARRAA